MSFVLDFLVFATGWGHIFLAPYTKVEESFNLHAVHDVLFYGISTDAIRNVRNSPDPCSVLEFPQYDHNIFPGAVPRTFIGSVLLAWLSQPAINLASNFEYVNSKFDLQIIGVFILYYNAIL
jgi:alpha-1,6-mannosyltransferase